MFPKKVTSPFALVSPLIAQTCFQVTASYLSSHTPEMITISGYYPNTYWPNLGPNPTLTWYKGEHHLMSPHLAMQAGIRFHGSKEAMDRAARTKFKEQAKLWEKGKRKTLPKTPELWEPVRETTKKHRGQVVMEVPYITPGTGELQTGWYCKNRQIRGKRFLDIAAIQSRRYGHDFDRAFQEQKKQDWKRSMWRLEHPGQSPDRFASDEESIATEEAEEVERDVMGQDWQDLRRREPKEEDRRWEAPERVNDGCDRLDIAYEALELKEHVEKCDEWWNTFETYVRTDEEEHGIYSWGRLPT